MLSLFSAHKNSFYEYEIAFRIIKFFGNKNLSNLVMNF